MGNTIWVLQEGHEETDFDHSVMMDEEKKLDRLSKELGVKKLSDFFDYSEMEAEFGDPGRTKNNPHSSHRLNKRQRKRT